MTTRSGPYWATKEETEETDLQPVSDIQPSQLVGQLSQRYGGTSKIKNQLQ